MSTTRARVFLAALLAAAGLLLPDAASAQQADGERCSGSAARV
ncbi:hypothetical protein [Mesorhizobium muleiense]|nr:hypothetical protein [Mesorhizobium muleiense]